MNYPQEISKLKYTHNYYVSVGVVDKKTGCVLQIDEFNNIHSCYHGVFELNKQQYSKLYPDRAIKVDQSQFFFPYENFDQILVSIFCQLINYFDSKYQKISEPLLGQAEQEIRFIKLQVEGKIDYLNLFQDIFQIYSSVMTNRKLLLQHFAASPDLSKYFKAPDHLLQTLTRLKEVKKLFILTYLDLDYTEFILSKCIPNYRDLFDYILLSKSLDQFFFENKPFRKYYLEQRLVGLGDVGDQLEPHQIYFNGNINDFQKLTGIKSKHTLYISEFFKAQSDVCKAASWMLCQICPQLSFELKVLMMNQQQLEEIRRCKQKVRQLLSGLSSDDINPPADLYLLEKLLYDHQKEMNGRFGAFGSPFQTTWALTARGKQLTSSCNLYCLNAANFYYYAPFVMFQVCFSNRYLPHQQVEMRIDAENVYLEIESSVQE